MKGGIQLEAALDTSTQMKSLENHRIQRIEGNETIVGNLRNIGLRRFVRFT